LEKKTTTELEYQPHKRKAKQVLQLLKDIQTLKKKKQGINCSVQLIQHTNISSVNTHNNTTVATMTEIGTNISVYTYKHTFI